MTLRPCHLGPGTTAAAPGTPPAACEACAGQHAVALRAAGCGAAAIIAACSVVQHAVPIAGLQCDGDQAVFAATDGRVMKCPAPPSERAQLSILISI